MGLTCPSITSNITFLFGGKAYGIELRLGAAEILPFTEESLEDVNFEDEFKALFEESGTFLPELGIV
jgi:hypothetical protein